MIKKKEKRKSTGRATRGFLTAVHFKKESTKNQMKNPGMWDACMLGSSARCSHQIKSDLIHTACFIHNNRTTTKGVTPRMQFNGESSGAVTMTVSPATSCLQATLLVHLAKFCSLCVFVSYTFTGCGFGGFYVHRVNRSAVCCEPW